MWGIVPSEWDLCQDKYTWEEFRRGDSWLRPEWETPVCKIMILAAGILMVVAWLVSIAAVHTIDKDFLSKNLGPPCVGAHGKRSFQSVLTQSTNTKKTEFKYVIQKTLIILNNLVVFKQLTEVQNIKAMRAMKINEMKYLIQHL